jgi:hypothetical protein
MGRQKRQVDSWLVERLDLLVHAGDILQEDWILEELSYLIQVSVSLSCVMLISDFCFSLAKTLLNEVGLGSLEKDTMKFSVQDF